MGRGSQRSLFGAVCRNEREHGAAPQQLGAPSCASLRLQRLWLEPLCPVDPGDEQVGVAAAAVNQRRALLVGER